MFLNKMQKHAADKGYDSIVKKPSDTVVEVLAYYFHSCISILTLLDWWECL